MSSYLKPQSPLKNDGNYIYPITTADQVVMDDGTRLNAEISKHLKIDINSAESAEPNGINADSLGGYSADEYMRKDQASVEVNYSVVNNLTKPTNEAEFTQNMIWIDTDVPIGRVFFGNNEPNEIFIDGDIWIHTGTTSSVAFNSLKIGDAYMNMIYPLYVNQYINSNWANMTAKSYQGGEWVDWFYEQYLYKNGNQYTDITGGFSAISTGILETDGTKLSFLCGQGNAFNCFATNNKIQKGSATKLILNVTVNPSSMRFGVSTTRTNTRNDWAALFTSPDEGTGVFELPFDDNVPNEFYVCVGGGVGTGTYTFEVNEIKLSN